MSDATQLPSKDQVYEQALRDILDPIGAMKRDLPEGYRLDGHAAYHLAGQPETYKDIARKALERGAAHEPPAEQAEIVTIQVLDGKIVGHIMKAPGLPDGFHDLFCEPVSTAKPRVEHRCERHFYAGQVECPLCSSQPPGAAFERGCYVLMEMMKAYERRIRSDCTTPEQIEKRPWECAEYIAAADFLKKVWPSYSTATKISEQT